MGVQNTTYPSIIKLLRALIFPFFVFRDFIFFFDLTVKNIFIFCFDVAGNIYGWIVVEWGSKCLSEGMKWGAVSSTYNFAYTAHENMRIWEYVCVTGDGVYSMRWMILQDGCKLKCHTALLCFTSCACCQTNNL